MQATGKEKIQLKAAVMLLDTRRLSFDMQDIENRRFMYQPQTGTLILGYQYRGKDLVSSHAEELADSGAKELFDSFIRGWVGTGREYRDGVIHFAPSIDSRSAGQIDRAFSTLEMFRENNANGKTVVRGFGDRWEQPLSYLIPERSDRMSEVFSIEIHNRQLFEQGEPGVWVTFPTTAEQLQEAMRRIKISTDNPQDFFLNGYTSPEDRRLALPFDMVLAADVDELNFLASRLEALAPAEIAELNAVALNPRGGFESIGQITDFPDNVEYYVHIPGVETPSQLGDYYLNRSGMVQMPEEWKGGIDTYRFGNRIANLEDGHFTPYGYLVKSGDEWQRVHEGQPVPEQYRVMGFPAPEVDRNKARTGQAATLPEPQPAAPIILKGKTRDEYMKEITDRLETGIQELMDSDRYKSYLTAMSKFHGYSFRNTMLIHMQKPDASLVAGLTKWEGEFERTRKKGERGLKILAPNPYTKKKQVPKLDPATHRPVIGADGKPVTEEQEITIPNFVVVSVYDISQTEGKEVPDISMEILDGGVERYDDFMSALKKSTPYSFAIEEITTGANGYCNYVDRHIGIKEGMGQLQTVETSVHEVTHARLYEKNRKLPDKKQPDQSTREVQAESVAFAVCQYFGLDTSGFSFGYIADWGSGRDMKELKASLETIRATANELINEIEFHFLELQKQRETVREQPEPEAVQESPAPEQPTFTIYQLKRGEDLRDYRFEPYERLQAAGLTVDPANYEQVYTAPLTPEMTLESIYEKFNLDHPSDFRGHSLSVSDIVVLHQGGKDVAHYCDSFGFQDVPEFLQERQAVQEQEAVYQDIKPDNPLKTAEMTLEQNTDMIDGVLNNMPTASEKEAGEAPEKQQAATPAPKATAEQPQETGRTEQGTAVRYYPINETAARHAKEANSFSDYRPGSATAEYRQYVDEAVEIAERQKKRVDPEYHEKIDYLLDLYCRKLAENMNHGYAIAARVPSVLIAGPANFPVRQKEKQNAASDRNMEEWQHIRGLLDKIRSTGTGGISADDPQAVKKLQNKLEKLEQLQNTMKSVNAYFRKNKKLDGCPGLTPEQIGKLKEGMASSWRTEPKPFESYELSNNNQEIHRIKERIQALTRRAELGYVGWEFDGGRVEANQTDNRLQIFFDEKPDADTRDTLKGNGFRWSPKAGTWQRQLNDNAIYAADRIKCIQPLSGEKPTQLQLKARKEKEKPSIRAQLKSGKEAAEPKKAVQEKTKEWEVG